MLEHKEILKSLVIGANAESRVSVRETNFGYIIRSSACGHEKGQGERAVRLATVAAWVVIAGLWLLPLGALGVFVKVGISGLLLGAVCLAQVMLRRDASGLELHVDTGRRELRSAVLTSKGESWIRNSARFGEVTKPVLQKGRADNDRRSLCLKIAAEPEVMPVAVGDEVALLAIHDRLMRDLRPMEERMGDFRYAALMRRPPSHAVFPQLGPDEIAA